MVKYSIILNIILLLLLIIGWVKYNMRTKHVRQLFIRSWYLETNLMDIYKGCDTETQNRIESVLKKIKPL